MIIRVHEKVKSKKTETYATSMDIQRIEDYVTPKIVGKTFDTERGLKYELENILHGSGITLGDDISLDACDAAYESDWDYEPEDAEFDNLPEGTNKAYEYLVSYDDESPFYLFSVTFLVQEDMDGLKVLGLTADIGD